MYENKYTAAPILGIARWSVPRIGQGHLEVKWKQTGPYLVTCVTIIFINFFLIKKGWKQLKHKQ